MARKREALEAYRQSMKMEQQQMRAMASSPPPAQPVPASTQSRTRVRLPEDPAKYAAQMCEEWISAGSVTQIIQYYPFMESPSMRRRVLTWATEKASHGDLKALLGIGIHDVDASVQRHLNKLLHALPAEVLLARIAEGEFSINERRTIPGLLGRCNSPEARKLLMSMANHQDSGVRASVMQALAYCPVRPELQFPIFKEKVLRDSSYEVRLHAAEGLAQLGTAEAVAALSAAAGQDNSLPEFKQLLASAEAKRRPRSEPDDAATKFGVKEPPRKPFPTAVAVKVVVALVIIAGIGYKLAPTLKMLARLLFR